MRLLVVEDEEHLAAAIADGLTAEGFDVDVVHNGHDGLWRAREGSYDAIVLDVLLPGIHGYKVCRTLRDEGVWTPILILTAKDGEYDEAEALDTGADDFLSKPFSFVVLLARIRAIIRRGAPPRPTVLTVGSLELDPGTRRARRGDTDIRLTAREFALLEFLMRKDGNVASKAEILDHVWGIDFQGDPNVVEVYVGYLRRKVDQPFGAESIETVRGAGYRLVTDQPDT
jgi:DNA-binding response OmpR family regulator